MNLKDVKFINNGDIIYYREKYYTVDTIETTDYALDRDELVVRADVIYELNGDK